MTIYPRLRLRVSAIRTHWSFHSAGQLIFGRGAIAHIGELISRRKLRRLFLVADKRLAAAGLVERVVAPLRAAGIELAIFDEGEAEPSVAVATAAAEAAARFGPDGVLGLGGGSNMDLAKIVAILVTHGGDAGPSISATTTSPARCCRWSACRRPPAPAAKCRQPPC